MKEKKKWTKEFIKDKVKKFFRFLLNPRFLICFGLAWIVTNGWSYILMGIGTFCNIKWMIAVSGAYLAFLWLPMTPEKIVTLILAMMFLRVLFPKDEKTLQTLRNMYQSAKAEVHRWARKHFWRKKARAAYKLEKQLEEEKKAEGSPTEIREEAREEISPERKKISEKELSEQAKTTE